MGGVKKVRETNILQHRFVTKGILVNDCDKGAVSNRVDHSKLENIYGVSFELELPVKFMDLHICEIIS